MMEKLETKIEGILINGVDIIKFGGGGRLPMQVPGAAIIRCGQIPTGV
jgi:hypothetical protein